MHLACTVIAICALIALDFPVTDALEVSVPAVYTTDELYSINVTCNATFFDPDVALYARWTRKNDPDFAQEGFFLVLQEVMVSDAGIYTCEATTAGISPPETGSAEMELVVQYYPRWDFDAFDQFSAHRGQRVTLECRLFAVPNPDFSWENEDGSILPDSSSNHIITSSGSNSDLTFYSVNQNTYGDYKCVAANIAGAIKFDIKLKEPGVPGVPKTCSILYVNSSKASLECVPGYLGGEDPGFAVDSLSQHGNTETLDTSMSWEDGVAVLVSEGLNPNTNYTLQVYGKNTHGRSDGALGLYISTPDGPVPAKPSLSTQNIIIICGVIGGVILVVIIIIITVVCCNRCANEPKSSDPMNNTSRDNIVIPDVKESSSQSSRPASVNSFQYGNQTRMYSMSFDDTDDRFNRHNSWGSFKKPSRHNTSSSSVNPGFVPESPSLHYSETPYAITVNFNPGESDVGYANSAYRSDHETSFQDPYVNFPDSRTQSRGSHYSASNPGSEINYFYDDADPYRQQPSLCGLGALSGKTPAKGLSEQAPYQGTQNPQIPRVPHVPSVGPQVPVAAYASVNVATLNRGSKRKPKVPAKPTIPILPVAAQDRPVANVSPMPKAVTPIKPALSQSILNYPRPPTFQPEVPWELPRDQLFFKKKIGEGSFGEVWRAKGEGILGRRGKQIVAVKMLKDMYTPEEKRCLMKELKVMQTLQPHPHIISLLGCCSKSEPICIIMEYAANGNLQDLLRKQRYTFMQNDLNRPGADKKPKINLTARDLTIFTLHVASGMEYISSRELLHRDLASRNVLVDKDLVCKVCDFGSARDIAEMREYETSANQKLPLRWMAPESLLSSIYSTHSDVWSFGIFLWEVVTLGSSPYPGMTSEEVMDFVQKGCRMAKPTHCSQSLYTLMRDCWSEYPPQRPPFSTIHQRLSTLLEEEGDNMFVDQMSDNAYNILLNMSREKI